MSNSFSPLNDFESKLVQAQEGEVTVPELMASLAAADLALPSANVVEQDWSGFQPLLFTKNSTPMIACFSAKERMVDYADMVPYCLVIKGRELLRRMPPGHGLVINPGQRFGFDVSPDGIAQIVTDFAS